jgi:heme-degrading monooxygenase HmoA
MAKVGQPYTSGNWIVKVGNEEEFVTRWTEFTEWSLANASGAESFYLIRDAAEPRHFISFGAWDDHQSVSSWRDTKEFQDRLARCREVCEDFRGTDYTLSAFVGA